MNDDGSGGNGMVSMCADVHGSDGIALDALPTKPPKAKRRQHVYLVQCDGDEGPIKIGIAVDPNRRLSELRIGCPYPMQLLATIWTDDADMDERRLHSRFHKSRIHGEWFECGPELLALAMTARREESQRVLRQIQGAKTP